MAIRIPLQSLTQSQREYLTQQLEVRSKVNPYGPSKNLAVDAYEIEGDQVYLPFYYGCQFLKQFPNENISFPQTTFKFEGKLREYQEKVVATSLERINKVRTAFLSMATGKGKTFTAIYLASMFGFQTMVLMHRINLFDQWEKSLTTSLPGVKVQILDSKEPIDPTAHFILMNPINVMKRDRKDFAGIGCLIVDEAHAICSEKMSRSLFYFCPRICIGLTATPDRSDDMDKILDLHFSEHRIVIPLQVECSYYKLVTKLVPPKKINLQGKTDWNAVLNFQAEHNQRNIWIIQICRMFSSRNILILCKRVKHTETLYYNLKACQESVDYTTGTKKNFDPTARILVTTFSKSGVGFDHPKLDMLIIASDVEEMFAQYFGRCVRREDVCPIVIDLVDDNSSLEKHFRSRKEYAISVGAKVMNFREAFPSFDLSLSKELTALSS